MLEEARRDGGMPSDEEYWAREMSGQDSEEAEESGRYVRLLASLRCTVGPVAVMVAGGWFATRHARPENTMFANPREVLAFTYEGRQLRVPEPGSWVAFDCTAAVRNGAARWRPGSRRATCARSGPMAAKPRPFKRAGLHRLECPDCPCYGYFTVAMLEAAGELPACFAVGCGARMMPTELELAVLLGGRAGGP
jgi:hypothetical protein